MPVKFQCIYCTQGKEKNEDGSVGHYFACFKF